MDLDSGDRPGRFPVVDSRGVEEESKPLMASNKLRFKLKGGGGNRELVVYGGKEVVVADVDHGGRRGSNGFDWICKICRKGFISVKALGGHMRVHGQEHAPPGAGAGGGGCNLEHLVKDGKPTCPNCGKSFLSMKSLFGHMRCHPERHWRGMLPPGGATVATTTTPSSTVSSEDDDDQVCYKSGDDDSDGLDLLGRLSGWPKKGKRSCIGDFAADDDYDEEEKVKGAVFGLMLMATGNDCYRYCAKKPRLMINGSCSTDSGKIIMVDPICVESDAIGKKRKRVSVKIKEEEKCYRCSICDKAFLSPQALGGHKSSAHNKIQIKNMVKDDLELMLGNGDNTEYHQEGIQEHAIFTPMTVAEGVTVSHICKICNREFSSGQALGGHMRRHWQGHTTRGGEANQSSTTSSSLTSVAGQVQVGMMVSCDGQDHSGSSAATADNKGLVLGFDLNQVPDDDDSEGAI